MIGEHGVRVSPLTMALVAGAIADGSWHPPQLVRGEPSAAGTALDPTGVDVVREGLREAVVQRMPELTMGVGEGEVHGQAVRTDQDDETSLHWFVGYQGDVAFAVLAEVDPAQTLWSQYAVTAAQSFLTGLANGLPETAAETPLAEADLTATEETSW
jgi:cell division protein FtsI/penicillin-binding protein 2